MLQFAYLGTYFCQKRNGLLLGMITVQHNCKPSQHGLVKTKKDLHAIKKPQVVEVSTDQVNLARPEKLLNNSSCGTEVRYIYLQ